MEQYKTVALKKETKAKLDKLKILPREPYTNVIERLIARCGDEL